MEQPDRHAVSLDFNYHRLQHVNPFPEEMVTVLKGETVTNLLDFIRSYQTNGIETKSGPFCAVEVKRKTKKNNKLRRSTRSFFFST